MKVVRDDIPTEGIKINGIQFKPGVEVEVDDEMGRALTERKGFREVTAPKKKGKGDK